VLHALLDLYGEGRLDPSSEEIAARAGLSPRSLFRYFDDIDDLTRAVVNLQYERVTPLLGVGGPADPPFAGQPLPDRAVALAQQRARLFTAVGVVGRVSRLRAPFLPVIAAELTQARTFLREQLARVLAPELAAMGGPSAGRVLATLDVLCSFEAHELWTGRGLSDDGIVELLADAIVGLVTASMPAPTPGR
jgi:AcrR family transcriptional regulator